MAEIERPTHKQGYDNNQGLSPITLNGIEFTDFSTFSKLPWQYVAKSQTNAQTPGELKRKLAAAPRNGLDDINHFLDMLQVNWNGATIEKANIENGNTKIISSTPEFLAVFQSLCIKIYDNLVKLNKTLSNGKVDLNNKLTTGGQIYNTLPQLADLIDVIAKYTYTELEKAKTVIKGKYNNNKLTGDNDTYQNLTQICGLLGVLCTYIYPELEKDKNVTNGKVENGKLVGQDATYKNLTKICVLLGVLCTYTYTELEANKTITTGKYAKDTTRDNKDYLTNENLPYKNVTNLGELLSVLCDSYIYPELEKDKTLNKSKVTNSKLTGGSTTIKNVSDLGRIVNTIANYVYPELEANKTITTGKYAKDTTRDNKDYLTNKNLPYKNVTNLGELLSVLCDSYIYPELEKDKTITTGKYAKDPYRDNKDYLINENLPYKNVTNLGELLSVLCDSYIYPELEDNKTITKGNYKSSGANKTDVKGVTGVCGVLSNLCSDFYDLVYEPKNRTGAIKNSFVITTPCGKDFSSDTAADKTALMPFTGIKDGEIYDVIFYNDSSADHTIVIKNKAALTNLPSGCTIRVPDGEMIEADCPKDGYVEINYMRVGNTIWVRSA